MISSRYARRVQFFHVLTEPSSCLAVVSRIQEPGFGSSRLAVLVESLASGADVFSSRATDDQVNEMEVVVDQLP